MSKVIASAVIVLLACSCQKEQKEDEKKVPDAPHGATEGTLAKAPVAVDFDAPLRPIEVKEYHILPVEPSGQLSGYCIATNRKPVFPESVASFFQVSDGPCPESLTLSGEGAGVAMVCPVHEDSKSKKNQTILYSKIQTSGGYKVLRELNVEVVQAFCSDSNVF